MSLFFPTFTTLSSSHLIVRREVQDVNNAVKVTMIKELQKFERDQNNLAAARQQRMDEVALRDEVYRPVYDAAKAKVEEDNRMDYTRRRELQLKEVQAKIDLEKRELEERIERELYERRRVLQEHWSEQAPVYRYHNTPYQHTYSTHSINTNILLTHPINTPSQSTPSTLPLNPLYQHTHPS